MNRNVFLAVTFLLGIGIGWSAEQFLKSSGLNDHKSLAGFSQQSMAEIAQSAAEWTKRKARDLRSQASEWLPRRTDDDVKPEQNRSRPFSKRGK